MVENYDDHLFVGWLDKFVHDFFFTESMGQQSTISNIFSEVHLAQHLISYMCLCVCLFTLYIYIYIYVFVSCACVCFNIFSCF